MFNDIINYSILGIRYHVDKSSYYANTLIRRLRISFRMGALIFVCFSMFYVSACGAPSSDFPEIPTESTLPTESEAATSSVPEIEEDVFPVIQMASPYSQDTLNYLSRLYEAKSLGLLGTGVNGDNVSLSFLDSIEPPFVVEALATPATGATKDTIMNWKSDAVLPDVFLASALSDSFENDVALSLNPYLSNDSLLNPSNTYIDMFKILSSDGDVFGIPLLASVDLLYVNQELFRTSDTELLSFVVDIDTFEAASKSISEYYDNSELTPSFPFYYAEDLLPFLGASYADSFYYMTYDAGASTFIPGFDTSVRFLNQYAGAGYSLDLLSEQDKLDLFGTFDPVISKRVAMWVGNSSDVMRWANYMPYTLQMAQIPSSEVGVITPPCLTIYPLCISATTSYPEIASRFASFVALDEDAILLRLRLEGSEGFLPTVKSNRVWTRYFENATYSSPLLYYKEYMANAYYSPEISDEKLYERFSYIIKTYSQRLLTENISDDILKEMTDVLMSA